MDFFKNLKDFFIPQRREPQRSLSEDDDSRHRHPNHFQPGERFSSDHYEDEINSFPIYTDPLEMHKYFEQQMNHMLREFGLGFGSMFHDHSGFDQFLESHPQRPMIEHPNIRDQYLKPNHHQRDWDLDDKNINELFKDKPSLLDPNKDSSRSMEPQIRSFGHQSVIQSIKLPNGIVEHTRKVYDSHGNVETTHTRMIGEQKYTLTRKKNSQGQEEQIEDFHNMEESHLPHFEEKWKTMRSDPQRNRPLPSNQDEIRPFMDNFPFDKFFK